MKVKIFDINEIKNRNPIASHQMNKETKILVVDDEKDLCEILQFNLESEGFDIEVAYSGEEALNKSIERFDLLLLDVMMGGMSGFRLADKIRKELGLSVPIIFLTARETENDMLTGFNVGADDYLSKPFSIKELVARINAVLRRSKSLVNKTKIITIDNLELDLGRKSLTIGNEAILLTRKEFEILTMLITNKGKYLSRQEILDRIWSDDVIVTERNVDVNIARLRKKIGDFGDNIKGRSGYGYCFEN
jgi:DNA-binding response OmpR family regulator